MALYSGEENRKAVLQILHMLLSSCGEQFEVTDKDEDGLFLSRLIDETSREFYGRRLACPTTVEHNYDVTSVLLAVLRECLITHRWLAALRVLMTVVHRLPKHYGRTVLHCVLELCSQLSLSLPDSLVLQLKTYAELTEYQVAAECFMWQVAAGQRLSACRATLAPLARRRPVQGRDDLRDRLLVRAYDGLASYAQYLDAHRTLEHLISDSEKELRDETSIRMKACARDALEKWDGLVDFPGVWDVFVMKQVELMEQAEDLDGAEDVLLKYAGHRHRSDDRDWSTEVWPNALHLLYAFYERHPHPDNDSRRLEVLEQLCSLVPSHHLTLTLYGTWRDDVAMKQEKDRIGLLFGLLDYAAWRDDQRPWRLLCRELIHCASSPEPDHTSSQFTADLDAVRRAWTVRKDWWPPYHFIDACLSSLPSDETMSLIGFKASVAHLLLSASNSYTLRALSLADRVTVKTKGVSQLKKVVRKWSTLLLDS